ncbi:MAG: PQQ-binding-like beta-propeller repeat protein [Candidatus Woesearchaeota archaeon]
MAGFRRTVDRLFKTGSKKIDKVWDFDSESSIISSSLVFMQDTNGDERVVFGTRQGKLYSLDKNGQVQWIYDSKEEIPETELMFLDIDNINSINSTPRLFPSEKGTDQIIFGSELGVLYSLDRAGKLLWKVKTGGPLRAMPLVVDINGDGRNEIVVGSSDNNIYIVSSEGRILRKLEAKSPFETTPLFVDNKLIAGTKDGVIMAFNPDGSVAWSVKTGDKITARAVATVFQDNRKAIIVPSQDNKVYALTYDGEIIWTFETGGAILSEVSVADVNRDGKNEICFGSCDNSIYCISDKGELIWSYETDFWVTTTPIITDVDGDGKVEVIAGSLDHRLYVLDGQGTYKLNYIPGVSGIVNQPGYHSKTINKDIGDQKGKKHCEYQVDGNIVGHTMVGSSGRVILNTKQGKIYSLKFR